MQAKHFSCKPQRGANICSLEGAPKCQPQRGGYVENT